MTSAKTELLDAKEFVADPDTSTELDAAHKAYCQTWNRAVGGGRLEEPMSARAFVDYMMEVIRHSTRSELAFIHSTVVEPSTVFPIEGSISRHDFFSGVPHRNRIYTFTLSGKELATLCKQLAAGEPPSPAGELLTRGISCQGTPRVNGRGVDTNGTYTAVTTEHVATGILNAFPAQRSRMRLYHPDPTKQAPILGALARDFLLGDQFSGATPKPIDIAENFPRLDRNLRWTVQGDLDLNVADTSIFFDAPYHGNEGQLARDEVFSMRGETRGGIAAASSRHGFAADIWLKYAQSRTEDKATGLKAFNESEDLATFNLLYKVNALRSARPAWWEPAPYAEGKVETELTPPRVDEGRKHHIELTGTLGARFSLLPEFEAKFGLGVLRKLDSKEERDSILGADIGYDLRRMSLFGSPIKMESELTTFIGIIAGETTVKGTWINRLYFSLTGGLALNVTHDLFFVQKKERKIGLASQLTVGLGYHAATAMQTF